MLNGSEMDHLKLLHGLTFLEYPIWIIFKGSRSPVRTYLDADVCATHSDHVATVRCEKKQCTLDIVVMYDMGKRAISDSRFTSDGIGRFWDQGERTHEQFNPIAPHHRCTVAFLAYKEISIRYI